MTRLLQPLLCLVALLSLGAAATAQDSSYGPPPGPRPALPPPPKPVVVTPAENQPWIGDDGRPVPYTPPATTAPDTTPKAVPQPLPDSLCTFDCSTRPALLQPGENGTLFVIATLEGLTVLTATSGFDLQYAAAQANIRLGKWRLPPPPSNSLAPGFGPMPVYSETAIVEIPIRVDDDAEPGLHQVDLACSTELHDGDAGKSLGRFHRELTVGIAVRGSKDQPAPQIQSHVMPVAAPAAVPEQQPEGPLPAVAPEDPLLLLIGGAAALLLLVAGLLWRHRRS